MRIQHLIENRLTCAIGSLLIVTLISASGCSRKHYRLQADQNAYDLVAEKSFDPRWALSGYSIELDPRSRYFDPYDPDRQPMPPDDPASHQFMHCVNGMKGWAHWHKFGDRYELENPGWQDYLGEYCELTEDGRVLLDVDSALRLSYVHSPTYQNQLETLYLSALDVSTERFRLQTQFFGGLDVGYNHAGDLIPPALRYDPASARFVFVPARSGTGGEQNRLTAGRPRQSALPRTSTFTGAGGPTLAMQRRFATAGSMVVDFANSFVWEFTSGDANFTTSLANFTLIQPLLRGAGRDVALEQLTIVERVLLGNMRAFQRYRHGFYTNVAIGDLGVTGPQRRGGFLGGTGLTGFTGTGSGGLGGVGAATGFGRGGIGGAGGGAAGGTGFAGGGAGTVGGFIGLLQQLQQIRNTQDSLSLQLRTVSLLEAYLDAGVIDLVQVDQFRQNIETERAQLLQAQNALLNSLENYVVGTIGLPPNLPIELDDQLIEQFQLVVPESTSLQNRIADFQRLVGELPEDPDASALLDLIDRIEPLGQAFEQRFASIEQNLGKMEELADVREQTMSEEERSLFKRERELLFDSFAELTKRYQTTAPKLDALRGELSTQGGEQAAAELVVWLGDLYRLVGEAILVQARARLESVLVEPILLAPDDAFQIALINRLDIMNSRADLVDTWRLIAFNADALQSGLDVVVDGDIATARNNAVSFRAPTANVRAGLRFDAPFTRLLERNNYRQALIDYQRDRRSFVQTLDNVHRNMLQILRSLEELRVNLEIQRRAVAISIRRVDLTQEELNEPVPPPPPGQPASQFGPTAALNLLTALSDLRNTQNNFMSVWLNYYATRMVLMRELGIMVLDEEGRWVDLPVPDLDQPLLEEAPLPPPVPAQWYDVVDVPAPVDDPNFVENQSNIVPVAFDPQNPPNR